MPQKKYSSYIYYLQRFTNLLCKHNLTLSRLSWTAISCYVTKFRILWLVSRADVLIMKTTKAAQRFLTTLSSVFVQIESQNRDIYEQEINEPKSNAVQMYSTIRLFGFHERQAGKRNLSDFA